MRVVKSILSLAVLGVVAFALVQVAMHSRGSRSTEVAPAAIEPAATAPAHLAEVPTAWGIASESSAPFNDRGPIAPPPVSEGASQAPRQGQTKRGAPPLDRPSFEHRLSEARALADTGKIDAALRSLTKLYDEAHLAPLERAQLLQQLDAWGDRLYFSREHLLEPAYVVQPGDSLARVGNKYGLSWEYLARVNGISDPRRIRTGQRLKVVRGPFEAVIDLTDFELKVLLDGRFVRRYDVGIGKDGTTPIGAFTVQEKQPNPKYWGDPVTEADDPENPLGEHWIGIGNSYGIHGTIEPESIRKRASAGCIRMLADDVVEVYDLLVVGSRVRIQQ